MISPAEAKVLSDWLSERGVPRELIGFALEALTPRGALKRRALREMALALRMLELCAENGLISGAVANLITTDGLALIRGDGPGWAERRRFFENVAKGHTPHCAWRPDCGDEHDLCSLRKVPLPLHPHATAAGFVLGVAGAELADRADYPPAMWPANEPAPDRPLTYASTHETGGRRGRLPPRPAPPDQREE